MVGTFGILRDESEQQRPEARPKGNKPDTACKGKAQKHGGAGKVFGSPDEGVSFKRDGIRNRFEGRVHQFNDQYENKGTQQKQQFCRRCAEPQRKGGKQGQKEQFLPERSFVLPGCAQPLPGIAQGSAQPVKPAGTFERRF